MASKTAAFEKKLKAYTARLEPAAPAAPIIQKKNASSAKKKGKKKMLRGFNKKVELIKK